MEDALSMIQDGEVQLVINTNATAETIANSFSIRRNSVINRVPYATTMTGAKAIVKSIVKFDEDKEFSISALQDLEYA